jgi:hypothetical protein
MDTDLIFPGKGDLDAARTLNRTQIGERPRLLLVMRRQLHRCCRGVADGGDVQGDAAQ